MRDTNVELETLVLVDNEDNQIGTAEKWDAHKGLGKMHRAFSVWVFTDDSYKDVWMQVRGEKKPLWPGYYSNSYCSHPREGESYEGAARRRGVEEIGLIVDPKMVIKFSYHASYKPNGKRVGSENELCALMIAVTPDQPTPNALEIDGDMIKIPLDELRKDMNRNQEKYTPWFLMEMFKIDDYLRDLKK